MTVGLDNRESRWVWSQGLKVKGADLLQEGGRYVYLNGVRSFPSLIHK
jgi:hypothetical protein